jgi:DNA-binding protein H-NS
MATYLELKEQAEKLMAQAEELRSKERAEAVAEIKQKMQTYEITAQDLGFSGPGLSRQQRRKDSRDTKAPKYRGPDGQSYAGGRGQKPKWLKDALAQGKRLEEFEVK